MGLKSLLIGNLSVDHNITESGKYLGPGGSVYFISKFLSDMSVDVTVLTPFGKDLPKKLLPFMKLLPKTPIKEKNLIFENINFSSGNRKQKVKNFEKDAFEKIAKYIDSFDNDVFDMIFLAPIVDNIPLNIIELICQKFHTSLKVLSPQGFFRHIDSNGNITPKTWKQASSVTCLFDIIVLSEKDFDRIYDFAKKWSMKGSKVIVTRASGGSSIYVQGKEKTFPSIGTKKVVDSTGSGDVFAAAFAYKYFQTKDVNYASQFANIASGVSLRFYPNQLEYNEAEIEKIIKQ